MLATIKSFPDQRQFDLPMSDGPCIGREKQVVCPPFLPPYGKALSIKERTLLAPLSLERERGVGGIGRQEAGAALCKALISKRRNF